MQYYDPIEETIPFTLYAKQALTQREKAKEEKEEKEEKKSMWANRFMTPAKILEAKRAGDITDKQTLMAELDKDTVTGKTFKSKEYVAPERKQYDPRRFKDWAHKRYGRSGRERVEYEELTPEAKKRGEIYGFRPGGPGGGQQFDPNVAIEKSVAPSGTRNPYYAEQKQLEQLSDPNTRHGKFDPVKEQMKLEKRAREHRLIQGGAKRYDYDLEQEKIAKIQEGFAANEYSLAIKGKIPEIDDPYNVGRTTQRVGNLEKQQIDLQEQAYDDISGYQFSGGGAPGSLRKITDPREGIVPEHITPHTSYDRSYGEQFLKPQIQAPSGKPISSLLGKKGLLGGSVSQEYGSFDELVKARNAARGTEGLGVIQEQVNQYMPKGTSYGEASKAFDAAKAATETAGAVETGGDVIGAAGTKATPGLGDIMTIAENFDPDKSEEEKIYDTIATGAAFAGPYGQTLSAIMKGGKFLYGLRNMG